MLELCWRVCVAGFADEGLGVGVSPSHVLAVEFLVHRVKPARSEEGVKEMLP